jgi:hypothetical protein
MGFTGDVKLAANQIKTIRELVQAAINTRTYPNAAAKQAAFDRVPTEVSELYITPRTAALLLIDAYAGVLNGTVSNKGDGVTLDTTYFTVDTNGGNAVSAAKDVGRYYRKKNIGNLVVYSGAVDAFIEVDFE